ncbi:MAG TPA: arginine--tRNA ligase [Candidatus Paceibacterota bacterium]|nr:arginine--tRNA ligase [Candidatus Paceibacterota bacterium]
MIDTIRQRVLGALGEKGLPADGVTVEFIEGAAHGDITTNAAMVAAKAAGMPPHELARVLMSMLMSIEGIERIEAAGPGFINFTLTDAALGDAVAAIGERYGTSGSQAGTRVMIEYTDPNPFKEFHIGHLMSNAIGESIARLTEAAGASVFRANYEGDVGPHVARALWGKLQEPELAWGEAYALGAREYEAHKEEIDVINRKVYDQSDPAIDALYRQGREESLAHFEALYALLGTRFDHYFFESETAPIGVALVEGHPEVFEESDGATVYRGEQDGLHTRVFITRDGLPTYEAKDLGLIRLKADTWPADSSITVTANEQQEYFKVMRAAAMRIMPELAAAVRHITHGMMRLSSGKMSSRTGDVITGESLLMKLIEAAKGRASESKADDPEQLAQQIAVAAIKFQILRQGIGKDIVFDEARALSLEGDSGPYVQYAHARACSVVAAAAAEGIEPSPAAPASDGERAIARILMRFPAAVLRAQVACEPHHVAQYANALASRYNSWYAQERVLGSDRAAARAALTRAVARTLRNALDLLGIEAPEKM